MPRAYELTPEELARLDDEFPEGAYYRYLDIQEKHERELCAKVRSVVAKLEKQLPSQVWQEVLELSDTFFGGQCIMNALFEKAGHKDLGQLPY
jgi:hypothetical protein